VKSTHLHNKNVYIKTVVSTTCFWNKVRSWSKDWKAK